MQVVEKHQWTHVAGGKVASGSKNPSAPGMGTPASVAVGASASTDNRVTTSINIVCDQQYGRITYKESFGGLSKELTCESNSSSQAAPAPSRAGSSPASNSSGMTRDAWKAFFVSDGLGR